MRRNRSEETVFSNVAQRIMKFAPMGGQVSGTFRVCLPRSPHIQPADLLKDTKYQSNALQSFLLVPFHERGILALNKSKTDIPAHDVDLHYLRPYLDVI